jgi:hypothetical protein
MPEIPAILAEAARLQFQDQPGLHSETLSQKKTKKDQFQIERLYSKNVLISSSVISGQG